jgi:hypothetical protein
VPQYSFSSHRKSNVAGTASPKESLAHPGRIPSTPRRSERTEEKECGMFALGMADCGIVCEEHVMCKPTSWDEYLRLLNIVKTASMDLTPYMNNILLDPWVEGQAQILLLIENGKKEGKECLFCAVTTMLNSESRLPWLASLLWVGEISAFRRSLICLEAEGENPDVLRDWAVEICGKATVKDA